MRSKLLALSIGLTLSACSSLQPPTTPPPYTEPPALADDGFITLVSTEDIAMSVKDLRAYLIENPFIEFFEPTENISPPDETETLRGEWLTPGAVRRVKLRDGHYVIERVLENKPELFSYQVWSFTNEAGRGVEQIVGEQNFIAIDAQNTRFEWYYKLKPKSALTGIIVKRRAKEVQAFMDLGTDAMAKAANKTAME